MKQLVVIAELPDGIVRGVWRCRPYRADVRATNEHAVRAGLVAIIKTAMNRSRVELEVTKVSPEHAEVEATLFQALQSFSQIDNQKSDIKIGDLVEWEVGGRRRNVWLTGDKNRTAVTTRRGLVTNIRGQKDEFRDGRAFTVRNIRADGTEGAITILNRYRFGPVPEKVEGV